MSMTIAKAWVINDFNMYQLLHESGVPDDVLAEAIKNYQAKFQGIKGDSWGEVGDEGDSWALIGDAIDNIMYDIIQKDKIDTIKMDYFLTQLGDKGKLLQSIIVGVVIDFGSFILVLTSTESDNDILNIMKIPRNDPRILGIAWEGDYDPLELTQHSIANSYANKVVKQLIARFSEEGETITRANIKELIKATGVTTFYLQNIDIISTTESGSDINVWKQAQFPKVFTRRKIYSIIDNFAQFPGIGKDD